MSAQAAINAAADADHITLISASMGRIFENTKYLDDESFVAFTKSLCRMSSEASGAPLADIDTTTGAKNSKAVSGNWTAGCCREVVVSSSDSSRFDVSEIVQQQIICN